MTQAIKVGQVRVYDNEYMGEIIYVVIGKQDPPWLDHEHPFEWLLLILEVTGPHLQYMTSYGAFCGADDYWLTTNTTVLT